MHSTAPVTKFEAYVLQPIPVVLQYAWLSDLHPPMLPRGIWQLAPGSIVTHQLTEQMSAAASQWSHLQSLCKLAGTTTEQAVSPLAVCMLP